MRYPSELHKKKIKLPTPAELLGDMDIDPETVWVEPPEKVASGPDFLKGIEGGPKKLLRQTQAHADLIYHFTKQIVSTETFTECSGKKLINEYLYCSLEAFLVIAYVNGHDKWMAECMSPKKKKGKKRKKGHEEEYSSEEEEALRRQQDEIDNQDCEAEESTDESEASTMVPPTTRYTGEVTGKGKYKGWKELGYILFNMVYEVLKEQRSDQVDPVLKNFQENVRLRFKADGSARKRANRAQ